MFRELIRKAENTPIRDIAENNKLSPGYYFKIVLSEAEDLKVEFWEKKPQKNNEEPGLWEIEFKCYSLLSEAISSNKHLFGKKGDPKNNIYSIHPNSFIVPYDLFSNKEFMHSAIDDYYAQISSRLTADFEEEILFKRQSMHSAYSLIFENKDKYFSEEIKPKDKVYLFLGLPIKEYEDIFRVIATPMIQLSEDTKINDGETIYFVQSDNYTVNSKKPFIKNRTLPSQKTNYHCIGDDLYPIYKLYSWLTAMCKRYHGKILINPESDILEYKESPPYYSIRGKLNGVFQGGRFLVEQFQLIDETQSDFSCKKSNFMDYGLDRDFESLNVTNIETLYNTMANEPYFEFFLNKDKMPASRLGKVLEVNKKPFTNAFKYQDLSYIQDRWEKFMTDVIWAKMSPGSSVKKTISSIRKLFLLKYNVLEGLDKKKGAKMKNQLIEIKEAVKDKILNGEDPVCENVDEYCFAAGQMIYYLTKQIATSDDKRNYEYLIRTADVKNAKVMKNKLLRLVKQHSHTLQARSKRLANLMNMIFASGVEEEDKINKDMIIAGFTCENILYTKVNNEEGETTEDEKK